MEENSKEGVNRGLKIAPKLKPVGPNQKVSILTSQSI